MGILERLLTRRSHTECFAALEPRVRRRLGPVCQELSEAEHALAARLGLSRPPRLLLIDEEQAVILTPDERAQTG